MHSDDPLSQILRPISALMGKPTGKLANVMKPCLFASASRVRISLSLGPGQQIPLLFTEIPSFQFTELINQIFSSGNFTSLVYFTTKTRDSLCNAPGTINRRHCQPINWGTALCGQGEQQALGSVSRNGSCYQRAVH